jgi:chemotaxis protein methyltransferase CheR
MNSAPEEERLTLSRQSFERFAQVITRELGIKMSDAKVPMLQSRLMRRLRVLRLNSLEEYQQYLFHSPHAADEHVHFLDAVTTNKTDFFREPQHFDYLSRTVLPKLQKQYFNGASWRFKLWCAGCSSGEEPYTEAMVLSEYAKNNPGFDFDILATDISSRVLDHAKAGIYDVSRIEPVPMPYRRSYLLRSVDASQHSVRIIPELRAKIRFQRLNFMDASYGIREQFDVVFFRNVMIYFDPPTQESVIRKLCRNLKQGGYFFPGHSESLTGLNVPLTAVAPAVFQKE